MDKREKRIRKIYCKILNAQRDNKLVSLFEKREGGEIRKLYDIQRHKIVCLFELNYIRHPVIKVM